MDETVYLSRRNLRALLSKLDRLAAGDRTQCAIIKHQGPVNEPYRQTMGSIMVVAVEDEPYYTAQERQAGMMHPLDEANITSPSTGTVAE